MRYTSGLSRVEIEASQSIISGCKVKFVYSNSSSLLSISLIVTETIMEDKNEKKTTFIKKINREFVFFDHVIVSKQPMEWLHLF